MQLSPPPTLGLDIGGANLKAVHTDGTAIHRPFALWCAPERLVDELRSVCAQLPAFEQLAITMTGELCDCFPTRRAGVRTILDAVVSATHTQSVRVWSIDGTFVDLDSAWREPLHVASANWLAVATFAGSYAPEGAALVIDIGSTTTDIIPLVHGVPRPRGRTDRDRLKSRELVYTGVHRTPVCAILGVDGAAELFATMRDVYQVLGFIADQEANLDTADGRAAVRANALVRLARMHCAELETMPEDEVLELARQIAARQHAILHVAVEVVRGRLDSAPQTAILAGSGEFLARALCQQLSGISLISLAEQLGPLRSSCACAHAVAWLCLQRALYQRNG